MLNRVGNNTITAKNNIAFKGGFSSLAEKTVVKAADLTQKLTDKSASRFDFRGISFSPEVFAPFLISLTIVPRFLKARDKDERREILTRDVISLGTILFAVPFLNKIVSSCFANKSGFVLAEKAPETKKLSQKIWNYFWPDAGDQVIHLGNFENIYSDVHNYKDGTAGFCKFIDKNGGNLGKMFEKLDSKVKTSLAGMYKEFSGNQGSIFEAQNSEIIKMFKKAEEGSSNVLKEGLSVFENSLKSISEKAPIQILGKNIFGLKYKVVNNFVKTARSYNALIGAFNLLVVTPLFLGLFLPKLNEKITKNKYKKQNAQMVEIPKTLENAGVNFQNAKNILTKEQRALFSKFVQE